MVKIEVEVYDLVIHVCDIVYRNKCISSLHLLFLLSFVMLSFSFLLLLKYFL